jgi:hypothetical protein
MLVKFLVLAIFECVTSQGVIDSCCPSTKLFDSVTFKCVPISDATCGEETVATVTTVITQSTIVPLTTAVNNSF